MSNEEVLRRFHALYYAAAEEGGTWASTYWMGVRVLKCPLDLWVYQEILFEVRPELIIECGTADGGSALYLAHVCDTLNRGEVVSIDVRASPRRRRHPRISYVLGSSTDRWVVETVRRRASRATSVLVILDSNHRADHVLQELRLYAPLVTPGSYVIVEDTNVNGHPIYPGHGPGPKEAIDAFLREEPSFSVDHGREKFYLSFNPSGFLRKTGSAPECALSPVAFGPARHGSPTSADACSVLHSSGIAAAIRHHIRARLRARALAALDRRSSGAMPKTR